MDYSSADMVCVLKLNTQCEACKSKVMRKLQRVRGVYNITIDGEEGTVKVSGRVNPSTLLRMLQKYENHAEVKYLKFDGEVLERNPLDYYGKFGYFPYDSFSYFQPPLPPPLPSYPPPPFPQPPQYPPPHPFAPTPPPAPFPPHPPHCNHHSGPHSLPPRPRPPPPPPPPPPVKESTQTKPKQCAIM